MRLILGGRGVAEGRNLLYSDSPRRVGAIKLREDIQSQRKLELNKAYAVSPDSNDDLVNLGRIATNSGHLG